MTNLASTTTASSVRLTSLDQFRGYTMFGMLLVNFLGGYAVCPRLLKHSNDYCSYADTIMPQFLFAVGFAMRLSLGKRRDSSGKMPWGRAVRRILGLAIVAIVWYSICDIHAILKAFREKPAAAVLVILFKREYFQTLLHIAATSLWILPVVVLSSRIRFGFAIFSGLLHLVVSWWFNFVWVNSDPMAIDGGPLGFLSWAIPALCGTLACDAVRSFGPAAATRIAGGGIAAMILGWGISFGTVLYNVQPDHNWENTTQDTPSIAPSSPSTKRKGENLAPDPVLPSLQRLKAYDGAMMEPPFVPPPDARHRKWNYWMMSQRCGSLSYLTFAGGFSLLIYAFFLWACDRMHWRLGLFRTLGTNSLAAYLLHDIGDWIFSPFFPRESPSVTATFRILASLGNAQFGFGIDQSIYTLKLAFALTGFLCVASFVYTICRLLERRGWYIRV